ncbi:hypothetical protein ASF10_02575 [Flavobacterium sp. Leaf82]|uniref:hypothetical protein n=1 Tax=unclassified Flavobacterium TaxID=196869 RepID=UPI0007021151|nr:hypothetical protein [Flavobacterium sp. Leaf82]KQO34616.1 hypothetical protein ASF10_02575 [Flavobacterium sp. Leaf82]
MKKKYKITFAILFITVTVMILFNIFSNDKKIHVLKEYSPEGKLLGTNEYVIIKGDTILQGKFINYSEKGIKTSEGQFLNNEPNGICSYYYDSGKIESVFYRKNSKINLESTYYNQNGLVYKYIMCDSLGNTRFLIKFDEKAEVKRYEGYSILPIGLYKIVNKKQYKIKKGDTLNVGDVIKHYYLLANIPHTKRTFKIENIGIDNSKAKRIIKSKEPTEIIIEEVLTQKGLNRIEIVAQYKFKDKVTPTLNRTISFDINVN